MGKKGTQTKTVTQTQHVYDFGLAVWLSQVGNLVKAEGGGDRCHQSKDEVSGEGEGKGELRLHLDL